MSFRSVVLLRRTLGRMRTSVALVISAGMSQDINHFPYEMVMPYWNANEASKVLLEYKSVVRI